VTQNASFIRKVIYIALMAMLLIPLSFLSQPAVINPTDATRNDPGGVLARQRRVVDGFAAVIAPLAPETSRTALAKPLTMILFGMINWTFTWLKDRGPLTYSDMAPLVADLFLGGIGRVRHDAAPSARPRRRRAASAPSLKATA